MTSCLVIFLENEKPSRHFHMNLVENCANAIPLCQNAVLHESDLLNKAIELCANPVNLVSDVSFHPIHLLPKVLIGQVGLHAVRLFDGFFHLVDFFIHVVNLFGAFLNKFDF